jgi:hypothetical protein
MAIDTRRIDEIATKYGMLTPMLDERQTRLWLAAEAKALGRGGIAAVTAATGIRDKRIRMGSAPLERRFLAHLTLRSGCSGSGGDEPA